MYHRFVSFLLERERCPEGAGSGEPETTGLQVAGTQAGLTGNPTAPLRTLEEHADGLSGFLGCCSLDPR